MHHFYPSYPTWFPAPPPRFVYPQSDPYARPAAPSSTTMTTPALYVFGSFTLMLVLAAVMSLAGTVAAQALLLDDDAADPPATTPAAL